MMLVFYQEYLFQGVVVVDSTTTTPWNKYSW